MSWTESYRAKINDFIEIIKEAQDRRVKIQYTWRGEAREHLINPTILFGYIGDEDLSPFIMEFGDEPKEYQLSILDTIEITEIPMDIFNNSNFSTNGYKSDHEILKYMPHSQLTIISRIKQE